MDLLKEYVRINQNYNELVKNIYDFIDKHQDELKILRSDIFETNLLDDRNKFNTFVESFRNDIVDIFEKKKVNENKIIEIFQIKNNILNTCRKNINIHLIGTVINVVIEFYHELYLDVKRNTF